MTPLLAERVIERERPLEPKKVDRANNLRTSNVPRKCPRVTAVYCIDKPNSRFAGLSAKPSDGLEPSTPVV